MINNVTLLGRLTAAPELKKTNSGTSVASICIAVDRRFKGANGEKETDFINCVAWKGTAEFICKYFAKGEPIAITGEIQTRNYTDRDGNKRTAVEVLINQAAFCGGKNNSNNDAEPANNDFTEYDGDDDLPF